MNEATARALAELNRRFYAEHGASFSATRGNPWPGWERLLPLLGAEGPLRVLDVGCGNGRFARFLAQRLPGVALDFVGVDESGPLLDEARRAGPAGARWRCGDAVEDPAALPAGPFDWIALMGVLHGVPGDARRRALLDRCAARLAPGGRLVFTLWRLAGDARLRARSLEWNAYSSRAPMPIDCSELGPGDHLLPWGDTGEGVRYCHAIDEREIADWVNGLELEIELRFRADGRSGDRNDYWLLRRPDDAAGA